ncbi:hypothetical protein POM88_009374 [Heracleum sosnowskyi]|uniref:RNase H type-1 domain-containing protein n=1 Tax=Heracleum sosnowskyi TaxID=360622 RepID=A0AAD8N8A2_9APIA|nr:hypothetical protein POM88_009374 [Heracleum sosnowskyi]
MSQGTLEFLIVTRIEKWGKASKTLVFGNDPLWRVNPHGELALHTHRISREYWNLKADAFDVVCAVDGAWNTKIFGTLGGGIGGCIKAKGNRMVYVFSSPINTVSSESTEVEAIFHVINLSMSTRLNNKRMVVCSDSTSAISIVQSCLQGFLPIHEIDNNIKSFLGSIIFLHYVPREINVNAYSLAKAGLNREAMAVYWA